MPSAPAKTSNTSGALPSSLARASASTGFGHSTESATNEATRTKAAAHAKSQSGIGRSARWPMPCADAVAGTASAVSPASIAGVRRRTIEARTIGGGTSTSTAPVVLISKKSIQPTTRRGGPIWPAPSIRNFLPSYDSATALLARH